jgi:two-component system, LytTR family, response regulator
MIKILIIDDEKLSRELIRAYLKPHADIEIVGECENGFEGVKAILENKPDLILLDIQMPKLSGFEMLELMDDADIPAIIFSTAYDQYAIKAFELSAADYLLKPYTEKRFNEALEKAVRTIAIDKSNDPVKEIVSYTREKSGEEIERIVVRNGSKITIIPIDKIEYIKAEDDFVEIFSDGKKHLKQMTMKYLSASLPSAQFCRIHRSYIVNINQINLLEAYSKDSYIALLNNGEKIPVSKTGYQELKELLNF